MLPLKLSFGVIDEKNEKDTLQDRVEALFPGNKVSLELISKPGDPTKIHKVTVLGKKEQWVIKLFRKQSSENKKAGITIQQKLHAKLPNEIPKIFETDKGSYFQYLDRDFFLEKYVGKDLLEHLNRLITNKEITNEIKKSILNTILIKVKELSDKINKENIVHNDFRAVNILVVDGSVKPSPVEDIVDKYRTMKLMVTDFEDAGTLVQQSKNKIFLAKDHTKRNNKCSGHLIYKNTKSTDMLVFLKDILYNTGFCFENLPNNDWKEPFETEYIKLRKYTKPVAEKPPPKKRLKAGATNSASLSALKRFIESNRYRLLSRDYYSLKKHYNNVAKHHLTTSRFRGGSFAGMGLHNVSPESYDPKYENFSVTKFVKKFFTPSKTQDEATLEKKNLEKELGDKNRKVKSLEQFIDKIYQICDGSKSESNDVNLENDNLENELNGKEYPAPQVDLDKKKEVILNNLPSIPAFKSQYYKNKDSLEQCQKEKVVLEERNNTLGENCKQCKQEKLKCEDDLEKIKQSSDTKKKIEATPKKKEQFIDKIYQICNDTLKNEMKQNISTPAVHSNAQKKAIILKYLEKTKLCCKNENQFKKTIITLQKNKENLEKDLKIKISYAKDLDQYLIKTNEKNRKLFSLNKEQANSIQELQAKLKSSNENVDQLHEKLKQKNFFTANKIQQHNFELEKKEFEKQLRELKQENQHLIDKTDAYKNEIQQLINQNKSLQLKVKNSLQIAKDKIPNMSGIQTQKQKQVIIALNEVCNLFLDEQNKELLAKIINYTEAFK